MDKCEELIDELERAVLGNALPERASKAIFKAIEILSDPDNWFIAETLSGNIVVLKSLPDECPLRFPTLLRKMWSGGEVQQWLNEQWEVFLQQQRGQER